MYPGRGTLRGASARGASFKPILHQNMSAPPGRTISMYSASPPSIPGPVKRTHFDPAMFSSASNINNNNGGAQGTARGSKPTVMQSVLIERYKRGELNPVSTLHHLSQTVPLDLEFKETVTTGNAMFLYFAFCAVIDGAIYKTGMGKTKKEAKSKAAELALEELLPLLEDRADFPEASGEDFSSEGPPPLPVKEKDSTAAYNQSTNFRPIHEHKTNPLNDQIPQAVKEQLLKLMKTYPEFSSCISSAAAFIIQSSSGCEVIAIGTGNFNTRESAVPNGRILHDSHAVVAARRSLMRYLYQHLLLFFSKSPALKQKSIFEKSGSNRLLGLKSDISLHLFISQLPKGAAHVAAVRRLNPMSMSAWDVSNQISLHLTVEGKVFSVFSCTVDQWDSKVVSMSVTDKLSRWQVLGYQGALLSHFIEPLYVKSILVGDSLCSDVRGLEIAVCQRVEGITPCLPMYYCMLQPHIRLLPSVVQDTSSSSSGGGGQQRSLSVNWTYGDSVLEVVDGLEGKTVEESPFKSGSCLASRLCKAAMLSRFTLAAKEAERQDLLATVSYREAKMMAKPYQEAKSLLKSYLQQQGYGSWVHKSPVSDQFSL